MVKYLDSFEISREPWLLHKGMHLSVDCVDKGAWLWCFDNKERGQREFFWLEMIRILHEIEVVLAGCL